MKTSFPSVCVVTTLLAVLLGLTGIIAISVACQNSPEPFALAGKQLVRLGIGVALMWITAHIPFEKLKKAAPYLAAVSLLLLCALLKYGVKINGMRGWFKYCGISFQPSEPGKLFFLLGLVVIFTHKKICLSSDVKKIAVSGIYSSVWLAVLILQPDLGTSAVYLATFIAVLCIGGVKWRYIFSLLSAAVCAATVFIVTHPYAMRRINGFLDPTTDVLGRNWHLNQILRAVARGSWTGVKSADAHWSKSYLPFSYNDSVFALVCETIGALGAILIPAAFILMFYLLSAEAHKKNLSPDRRLFVNGTVFMLVFQSFLHISVNTGLAPVTGITMLFVSYGGSSMISGCILLGAVYSALHYPEYDGTSSQTNVI